MFPKKKKNGKKKDRNGDPKADTVKMKEPRVADHTDHQLVTTFFWLQSGKKWGARRASTVYNKSRRGRTGKRGSQWRRKKKKVG